MIYWYFGILIALAVLAHIGGLLAIASLLLVPGAILVAANNLLIYSILLLPFFVRPREMMQKPIKAAFAVLPALVVAFGLPQLSQSRLDTFIAYQQREDFDSKNSINNARAITIVVPRSADLACNDLCERLLYNREVDRVVKAYWDNPALQGTAQTVAYRIEKQAQCETGPGSPGPYSAGSQARRAAGECVVREQNADPEAVDATVAERPLYYDDGRWSDPRTGNDAMLFSLHSISLVTFASGGPRAGKTLLRRTLVSASATATPLHVTTTNNPFSPQLTIATAETPSSGDVLERTLKEKCGFRLAEVSKP